MPENVISNIVENYQKADKAGRVSRIHLECVNGKSGKFFFDGDIYDQLLVSQV